MTAQDTYREGWVHVLEDQRLNECRRGRNVRREMERGGEQEIVGRDGLLQMTIVGYKRNVKISLKDACFPFFLWSTLDRGRD